MIKIIKVIILNLLILIFFILFFSRDLVSPIYFRPNSLVLLKFLVVYSPKAIGLSYSEYSKSFNFNRSKNMIKSAEHPDIFKMDNQIKIVLFVKFL